MKYRRLLLPLLLVLCGVPAAQAQRTGAAVYIPSSMYGTFDLEMTGATPYSPYPNDTAVSLTLAIDGSLCAPGLRLPNPITRGDDTSRIYWTDADIGLELSLDVSGEFAGFGIGSPNGDGTTTSFGVLTGERAEARDPCDVNNTFFELAEANYPELFPESIFVLTRLTSTSFHRYYSVTGITLGISNGVAFARGGPYQGTVLLGPVQELVDSGVDKLVVGTSQPVTLPAILAGTYAVNFAAAGPYSPIPGGTTYKLALTTAGDLCLDGVVLRTPYQDPSDPNLVYWGNPAAGFVLQLDLAASEGTGVQFRMVSDDGLLLGTLSGTRSALVADCAGVLGDALDLAVANELFALAELVYPATFPASALTFNRFDGTSLLRHYPGTGVLVTVTGNEVYVSGGGYGEVPRFVGMVDALRQSLQARTPGFIPHRVRVAGTVTVELASLPAITHRFELDEAPVALPSATDTATLSAHVRQLLGDELRGSSTFTFRNVVSGAGTLSFDVDIANASRVVATSVQRDYTLRFVYTKQ